MSVARWVGIDIGGTNTRLGFFDDRFSAVASSRFSNGDTDDTLAQAERALRASPHLTAAVEGIGVAVSGEVDATMSSFHNPWTLGSLSGRDIATALRGALGIPTVLINDADAAVLAECNEERWSAFAKILVVTVGTGIGVGLTVNGQFVDGPMRPERGHLTIPTGTLACYCGLDRCWESNANGDAWRALSTGEHGPPPSSYLRNLAAGLAILDCTIAPELTLLGGGVGARLGPSIARLSSLRSTGSLNRLSRLHLTALGDDAGTIGAARWAKHATFGQA